MGYVGIVQLEGSNSRSVHNSLTSLGFEARFVNTEKSIASSDKLILPGVGHIASVVFEIEKLKLRQSILNFVKNGNFLLGICLGTHLLGTLSDESSTTKTLGLLDFTVSKLDALPDRGFRIPHVGWNTIEYSTSHSLLNKIPSGTDFYFSHSYGIRSNPSFELAKTRHLDDFSSVVGRDNVFGVQFHPEKSQKMGSTLLSNFCEL